MKNDLMKWMETLGLADSERAYYVAVMAIIVLTSLLIHFILHRIVLQFLGKNAQGSKQVWQRALFGRNLFTNLALTLQGVIIYVQAKIWLDPASATLPVIEILSHLWILFFALLSLFSMLDTVEEISRSTTSGKKLPLRGIAQSIKLVAAIIVVIFSIALLIGKSPFILFSGLGAMTAVLLLVFKDPLLGLVAGIQLSANKMLTVGDWVEMPKYDIDGDVIDISLTTVKVQNWDKTIATIPTYSLISESFKNWRGMTESGGRRIKRSINIDATSVKFLSDEDLVHLRKVQLLTNYIEHKIADIASANKANSADPESPANGRRLTNLGTFRAYLTAYLKNNKSLHTDMTQMVRQLSPGADGIPMEVYAFSNKIDWVSYEGVQADVFDHIFAVIPEFGLRIYQSPTGHDMQQLGKNLQPVA